MCDSKTNYLKIVAFYFYILFSESSVVFYFKMLLDLLQNDCSVSFDN